MAYELPTLNCLTLPTEWIGRRFIHYSNGREYAISDIHTVFTSQGIVKRQTFVTQNFCLGQLVSGETPWATISRSVSKNGWKLIV
jgi:hypothetical protein